MSSEKYRTIMSDLECLEKSIFHCITVRLTVQMKRTSDSEQVSNLRIGLVSDSIVIIIHHSNLIQMADFHYHNDYTVPDIFDSRAIIIKLLIIDK